MNDSDIRARTDSELLDIWAKRAHYGSDLVQCVRVEIERRHLHISGVHPSTAAEQMRDPEVPGLVFNLPALRVGQIVLAVLFVAFGTITFSGPAFPRDLVRFPCFGMGSLLLIYSLRRWKRSQRTLDWGFFLNTFATMLAVWEMAINGIAMAASHKPEASAAFLMSFIMTIISAGFASSFNKLRKAAVRMP